MQHPKCLSSREFTYTQNLCIIQLLEKQVLQMRKTHRNIQTTSLLLGIFAQTQMHMKKTFMSYRNLDIWGVTIRCESGSSVFKDPLLFFGV